MRGHRVEEPGLIADGRGGDDPAQHVAGGDGRQVLPADEDVRARGVHVHVHVYAVAAAEGDEADRGAVHGVHDLVGLAGGIPEVHRAGVVGRRRQVVAVAHGQIAAADVEVAGADDALGGGGVGPQLRAVEVQRGGFRHDQVGVGAAGDRDLAEVLQRVLIPRDQGAAVADDDAARAGAGVVGPCRPLDGAAAEGLDRAVGADDVARGAVVAVVVDLQDAVLNLPGLAVLDGVVDLPAAHVKQSAVAGRTGPLAEHRERRAGGLVDHARGDKTHLGRPGDGDQAGGGGVELGAVEILVGLEFERKTSIGRGLADGARVAARRRTQGAVGQGLGVDGAGADAEGRRSWS